MLMSENYHTKRRSELELGKILEEIWAKAVIIVLIGAISAFLVMLGTQIFGVPKYEAQTKLFVLAKQSRTAVTSSDMEASTSLTQDYMELIKSRTVLEQTIAELGLDMRYEELLGMLTVTTPVDTRVISIGVSSKDPYLSAFAANTICDIASSQIRQVMNVETINVVERADIPVQPTGPGLMASGLMGGMVGILLALAAVTVRTLTDSRIRTSRDVKYYLGLEILGSIPIMANGEWEFRETGEADPDEESEMETGPENQVIEGKSDV